MVRFYSGKNIPMILGRDQNLYETDKDLNSSGCFYQKSVPEGANGRLDNDLLYGLNTQLRISKRIWYDAVKGFNLTRDFADLIDSMIKQTGKKPTIIAIGPVTNIATLLRAFPTYSKKIERVVWLAGALKVPGNLFSVPNNTGAEFNVFLDCVAANELLASELNITLLPLDFTSKTLLNAAFFDKLSELTSFYGKFTYNLLSIIRATWFDGYSTFFAKYQLWDPKAVSIVKGIDVSEPISNRSLAVTCVGDVNCDGQFMVSRVLTKANLYVALMCLEKSRLVQMSILSE
ncbi:13578_t:CDS:2 [Acaulospora morrowiae]|uniref:13578_t:CDS:1 n=1 Tax=Acaulospora morrowiae TaxID=94023 RepID=A0A9N8VBZ8_9GLOM|nr:13578_t:CDS:2 [Acaulospora morrowiae]